MLDYFTFANTASIEAITELLCASYDGTESCERINESTKQACERVNPLKIITPALTIFSWWQLINSINNYQKSKKRCQEQADVFLGELEKNNPTYHAVIERAVGNTNKLKIIKKILSYPTAKLHNNITVRNNLYELESNLTKQKQLWNDNKYSIALNIAKTITLTLMSTFTVGISLGALSLALPYIFIGVCTGEMVKSAFEARSIDKEVKSTKTLCSGKKEKITERNGKILDTLTTAVITVSSVIAIATPPGLLAMSILSAASLTIIGANLTRKAYLNSSSVRNKNYLTQLIFGKEQKKPKTNNNSPNIKN